MRGDWLLTSWRCGKQDIATALSSLGGGEATPAQTILTTMSSNVYLLLLVLCIVILCTPGNGVYAFGAGNIPRYALPHSVNIIRFKRTLHHQVSHIWRERPTGMVIL